LLCLNLVPPELIDVINSSPVNLMLVAQNIPSGRRVRSSRSSVRVTSASLGVCMARYEPSCPSSMMIWNQAFPLSPLIASISAHSLGRIPFDRGELNNRRRLNLFVKCPP
jgi:hypothetical protein